jgi:predicted  nucleic acid-binding Zn-ribbon protein
VKKSLGAEHILEKFVPRAKLLSFLVENREDELLLNEELRVKRRLTININTMYNRGTHQSPYSPSFLEQGRAWGLQGMIADLYEMPDLVRAYLNTFLAFHCCLWSKCPSSTLSSDILSSLCLNKQFRLFVVETKMQNREEQVADITEMSGKVSRYNPNAPPSTVSEPVRPAQLIQTGGADITEKKERLEHVVAAARAKVEDIKRQIDQHRAENQRCQDRITQIRSSLGKAKAALDMPKNIKKRLDGEKKKRADLEERLASGAEKDKKFAVKKLSKTVDSFLLAVEVVNSSIAKCVDATVQKAHASYSCRGVRNELIRAQDDLDDANQQLTQLKREMNDREDERDRGKKKNEKVEERVGQVQERVGGEQAMNDLFRKFTSEISNGNSMSLDDLEHKAAEIRGQLNATVENPQLMRRSPYPDPIS